MDPNQQFPQQPQQPQQPQMPQQPQAPIQPQPQQQFPQPQNPYQPQAPQQPFQQPYQPQQPQQQYQPSYGRPPADPQPMPQSAYDTAFATDGSAPGISKWPIIAGAVGLLLGLGLLGFVVFGGGGDSSTTPAASTDGNGSEETSNNDSGASASEETPAEQAAPSASAPIPVGKTVELRAASLAFDLTVVEVIRGATSSNEFRTPEDGFENVMVKIRVANKGEIERSFFASNVRMQVAGEEEPRRNSSSYAEFSQPDDWPDYAPAYDAVDRIPAGGSGEGYIMYILPDNPGSVEAVIDWRVNVIGGDDVDETFTIPLY